MKCSNKVKSKWIDGSVIIERGFREEFELWSKQQEDRIKLKPNQDGKDITKS